MRQLLRLFLVISALAAAAYSAAPPALLPFNFGGWTAAAPATAIQPTSIDSLLGQDSASFREYILKSIEQRTYTQGGQSVSITLYRLRDPSSAYGAYTFLRNDSLAPVDLGSYASTSSERALIVVGEMLLDVTVPAKQARPADAELKQLADTLDKRADHTPYPFIGDHLPEKGRVRDSQPLFQRVCGRLPYTSTKWSAWRDLQ